MPTASPPTSGPAEQRLHPTVFTPLLTDRLCIRPVRPTDAEALAARRNDPSVAEFQTWVPPYTLEQAEALVAETGSIDGPTDDAWWMATVTAADDDATILGDVVVRLGWNGRTAEIGYSLARDAWGHGYAVEAASALVEYLFTELGVHRVEGMLHPDNRASAMVLERVGMLFEGHTKGSFWVGDVVSDDWLYGMTRTEWEAWRDRARARPDIVDLVEIDDANLDDTLRVATHGSQRDMVAPVSISLGEALVASTATDGRVRSPWFRAVRADDVIVGFVMLDRAGERESYLWRLVVDRMHQRRGIGRRVLDLVVEQSRSWGDTSMTVSWVPGKGSPEPLYLARGFVPTGLEHDGELQGRLVFD